MKRKIKERVPFLPLSVLIFISIVIILWKLNIIPPPEEIFTFLENLYKDVGLFGLFIAAFLEGIVYIGHYFPGMSIIFISIIVSNEQFSNIVLIIFVTTIAITLSSVVNYGAGRLIAKKRNIKEKEGELEKTLLVAALHPAFLSLYFLHSGLKKKNFWNFLYVPILVFPYGIIIAYILYNFSGFAKTQLFLNDFFFFYIFLAWFLLELFFRNKEDIKGWFKHKNK